VRVPLRLALPSPFREQLEGKLPSDVSVAWFGNAQESLTAVADADVLWLGIGMRGEATVAALDAGPRLRWVHTHGAGTDRHPLEAFRAHGVIFTNGSGIGSVPIAEYVVMAMLAAAKGLPDLIRLQAQHEWRRRDVTADELLGSNALILGYGAIGQAVGARLVPFGVDVTGVRRRPDGAPGVIGLDDWRSRLETFDWIIISTILTPETRQMIGAAELARMRPSAWIFNISRGGNIDQAALIKALQDGHIGGAYLDVTDSEPLPKESVLWDMPNVIITPHSSWSSSNITRRSAELFLELLKQFRSGAQLSNTIDLEHGYRVTTRVPRRTHHESFEEAHPVADPVQAQN